jgi:hypothetical protein
MFIKDGKSIFGNVGLLISLIILAIMLFFSYNRCIAPFENSVATTTTRASALTPASAAPITSPTSDLNENQFFAPKSLRINIKGSTLTVNFTVDITNDKEIPSKFIVILAQYDFNYKPTGNTKFFLSNEYAINTGVSLAQPGVPNTNLCNIVNGEPFCQYAFNNLDQIDIDGNPYYYKLGISSVYPNGNSKFVTPSNVLSNNGLFSLTSSIETQNNQFNEFIKFKQMQQAQSQLQTGGNYSSATSTADGHYELLKSHLGNYPSNLIMDPISAKQNLLNDIVDQPMVNAILNVNVSANPIQNNAL